MNLTARIAAIFNRSGSAQSDSVRAAAMPSVSRGSKGSGAPSPLRARSFFAALAVAVAAFAITAASALAAPTVTTPVVSDVSYTTAHVTSEVTPDGDVPFTTYQFQVSTNGTDWTPNAEGSFLNKETLNAELTGLEDGTQYSVRLKAFSGFAEPSNPSEVVISPGPNPSFTTLTAEPPTIPGAVAASTIFSTSATGTAEVNRPAASDNVKCHFEYISDADFNANPPGEGFAGATVRECTSPIEATGTKKVKAPLGCINPVAEPGNCLSPNTTYHLRLVAENAGGTVAKDAASTFTTAPKVAAPTVTATDDASEIGPNSAKLTGKVQRPAGDDPALDTACHFEYITDAQFTANPPGEEFAGAQQIACVEAPPEAPLTSPGEATVSAEPVLIPETTYHLRLVAENADGTDAKDAASTFTTPEAERPDVTIDPVAGGTYTTAHVSGTVEVDDPGRVVAALFFEISTDNVNWSAFEASQPSGSGPQVVQRTFTSLQPSTTYFFRIKATYNASWEVAEANGEMAFSPEPNPSITTEALFPPTAEDLAATDITGTSAHLSATVDPHAPAGPLSELGKKAFATHWEFVCTPECPDDTGTSQGTVQGEEGAQTVSFDAKRLQSNTPYEVHLIAKTGGELEASETLPFSTLLIDPTVKSSPGASDGQGGYTLQGVVNPNTHDVTSCKFHWGPIAAPKPEEYAFSADCSPPPGEGGKPVTVEAHLTGLTPGAVYHSLLVITYDSGTEADGGPQKFEPTLAPAETCPNEALRKESNSLALPECRAYEMVTPPGKEGFDAEFLNSDGGDRVAYRSGAGNIAKSGQLSSISTNYYVATRSLAGWETIPNLNGPNGSIFDAPADFNAFGAAVAFPRVYSSDLLSSVWFAQKNGSAVQNYYLRRPDGSFTLIAPGAVTGSFSFVIGGTSDDLSHLFVTSAANAATLWGPGVYEFLGTGNQQPTRRVDVDNSGSPISTCGSAARSAFNSRDGRYFSPRDGRVALVSVVGGCGGANPPAQEIWARIDGTTSVNVSASQCNRIAPACNAPADATFVAATTDGSRVFFTTKQQLLDADTDETNDLYACDIPSGTPAPVGDGNPCSALRQVSAGDPGGAVVESFGTISDDGSTALFTAKGVLAGNEDALGEEALVGDHNLYAWRTDAAHPEGQTSFVGRLDSSNDLNASGQPPQSTPNGRYLVFTTASQLLDTDTDNARDLYRYDADTSELIRLSTNVFGVAGNGDGFDAAIAIPGGWNGRPSHPAISDDGQKIVFATAEALSAADGNGELDAYLWTPSRVSLISTGSVGGGVDAGGGEGPVYPVIGASGRDIYLKTPGALTPADGDDSVDVYDARIGGGFSFAPESVCTGENCQPPASGPLAVPAPATAQPPADPGNVKPKTCPKGKVLNKKGKCVKKPKKHSGKKHHGKKASHKQGGGK